MERQQRNYYDGAAHFEAQPWKDQILKMVLPLT